MPYITPQDIPESDDCRSLSIPASPEWLALFGGALTTFLYSYNWEQTTGITVDDTIEKMREIIDGFYEGCVDCELPGGGSIIRININGKIEILQGGEWVEPTEGDYYIPPPDARGGGTESDQICLAAKNAVNVLHELYSSLSDSFTSELTAAQALAAMVEIAVGLVGFAFAPIAFGIAAFFFVVFELLYGALSYLTADLWTADFEAQITCFLIACADNSGGVVTFDWQCFNDQLNSLANEFSLSEVQLRLYLQIGYILQFIGGADGLNLAARTTAITDDDCSFCEEGWCVYFDFTTGQHGWELYTDVGSYEAGVGFKARDYGTSTYLLITAELGVTTSFRKITLCYESTGDAVVGFGYNNGEFQNMGTAFFASQPEGALDAVIEDTTTINVSNLYLNPGYEGGYHPFTIKGVWLYGDFNPKPTIGDDCPEEVCP